MKYYNSCSSNSILVRFYITFVAHSERKIILSNYTMINIIKDLLISPNLIKNKIMNR